MRMKKKDKDKMAGFLTFQDPILPLPLSSCKRCMLLWNGTIGTNNSKKIETFSSEDEEDKIDAICRYHRVSDVCRF